MLRYPHLGAAAASMPPPRQLMPERIINVLENTLWRMIPFGSLQKRIYKWGKSDQPGLEGGQPVWIYTEFNPLGALKTGRNTMVLPDHFTLLNYFAYASVTTHGGFYVSLYDVNRRITICSRPLMMGNLAGSGAAPFFQRAPYPFVPEGAQCKVTIINKENANNVIQFGLYGVQGGQPE
jgi:hypothetical protein